MPSIATASAITGICFAPCEVDKKMASNGAEYIEKWPDESREAARLVIDLW